MLGQFFLILGYSLLAAAGAAIGFYLVVWQKNWAAKNSVFLISFAAGALLATALLRLLPESIALNEQALWSTLGVFLGFYFLEHLLIIHACQEEDCQTHQLGPLSFLGIGFHSLLDGVIIGAGFEASFSLGLLAAVSVILHKLSDGISVMAILLHAGFTRGRAILLSWLVALATPLGALLAFLALKNITITPRVIGWLLAGAAGSFLYIAASDLIPEIHKKSRLGNLFWLLLGASLPVVIAKFFG